MDDSISIIKSTLGVGMVESAGKRIVAIGECMVELAPSDLEGDFCCGYAGDTFNTAWYLKQLLSEVDQVDYFTAIGLDAISNQMLKFIRSADIGTSHILRRVNKGVGLYMIQLQDGERTFSYWRNDSAARTLACDAVPLKASLEGADLVYFSGITLAILPPSDRSRLLVILDEFRQAGGIVAFDPNLRPTLWKSPDDMTQAVMEATAVSDIALPSYDDEARWFGDENPAATLDRYLDQQVNCCVVKNGADRLFAAEGGRRFFYDPNPNVSVVDSTAAGDSFNAGFIAARLHDADLGDALQAGATLAAQVVAKRGALVEIVPPTKNAK
jgi:2-dehydro-3-deoxygluconokinase